MDPSRSWFSGDVVSKILAASSLLPLAVVISYFTTIFFRRDLHTIFLFGGQAGNEMVNWVIKHWVKEPRPQPPGLPETHWGKYGFPSNHAQFIWFFTTYMWLFLLLRLKPGPNGRLALWKFVLLIVLTSTAVVITYGRVELGQHTWKQVWWGSIFGFVIGLGWFLVVHFLLTPFFPRIASWPACEYFLIRDYSLIPNVMLFEYTCARSESRSRGRKLSLKRN